MLPSPCNSDHRAKTRPQTANPIAEKVEAGSRRLFAQRRGTEMNAPGMGRSMQAGGTPEFMQKFLSDMQVSCECWSQFTSCMARSPKNSVSQDLNETLRHARQEASRGLRTWGDELREETPGPGLSTGASETRRGAVRSWDWWRSSSWSSRRGLLPSSRSPQGTRTKRIPEAS